MKSMLQIKPFINKDTIIRKTGELVEKFIQKNSKEHELIFVTVLTGAKTFANEFLEIFKTNCRKNFKNCFIKLSSYGAGTSSSGEIKVLQDIEEDLKGKAVCIIEDIVDTGLTMDFLINYLKTKKQAKSVQIITLLDKPSRRKTNVSIDFIGFEVPDKFVVGFGIDFNQQYRELDYIGVLEEGKE